MQLTLEGLKDKESFKSAGITLPEYKITTIAQKTKETPRWIHFGIGNIFRIFIGGIAEELINLGKMETGITCVETFDFDVVEKIYKPYDNLVLGITLNNDGSTAKRVIGSLGEALTSAGEDFARLKDLAKSKELELFSFTITEKGYALKNSDQEYFPWVKVDIEKGPSKATSAMSVITALLWERFKAGAASIAVVSLDNCSHNGEKLQEAIMIMAQEWLAGGFVSEDFLLYLQDENKVGFPWSMIDKITPRPAESVAKELRNLGLENMEPIITSKNTYIAPFVNAEGPQYLVIEDKFPNGRPAFEEAGVYMTDRETVNKVERMKVTTCLNPLHTALAVYGCLLGYHLIAKEMKDENLRKLINKIGPQEGMKVVTDPGILSPQKFVDEVINVRFPNPFMPDTPQRIATDTSQKVGIRYGETIKAYSELEGDASSLVGIPLAIAGWCRYLLGVDDNLEIFELSSDPLLEELKEITKDIVVGEPATYKGQLKQLLAKEQIFGINLYKAGIGNQIEKMFVEQLKGQGAVKATLEKYL